jgi:hypothetical protein
MRVCGSVEAGTADFTIRTGRPVLVVHTLYLRNRMALA